jgi:hypothetical protein
MINTISMLKTSDVLSNDAQNIYQIGSSQLSVEHCSPWKTAARAGPARKIKKVLGPARPAGELDNFPSPHQPGPLKTFTGSPVRPAGTRGLPVTVLH